MSSTARTSEDDFKAAFDLTQVWGRDVWRTMLAAHDLTLESDTSEGFVWSGPNLTVHTTCNPLNGHHYRLKNDGTEWTPADRLAYCSYIHLHGQEAAVKDAVTHIRQNSHHKEVSVGHYCV
jgi:hypothetical protein